MPNILMAASEAAPFVKTGGLADVLGSLPQALARNGHKISVVIPNFRGAAPADAVRIWEYMNAGAGLNRFTATILRATRGGVDFYFVDIPFLYDREGIYSDKKGDYPDNHIRFAAFSQAVIGIARHIVRPDVIHCHDWQAALVPFYLRHYLKNDPRLGHIKTLFTIHNLGYQGLFSDPYKTLADIGIGPELFTVQNLEFFGNVNFLKAGLTASDALSTVSKGYAREIQTPEYGFGLDGVLRDRSGQLTGILNGVDYADWDPRVDRHIAAKYGPDDLSGKKACREALLEAFGLPADVSDRPILGIVSRFAGQKGFDLLAEISGELLACDITLIALGTGEPQYEEFFLQLAEDLPWQARVKIGYDNRLAHMIEAGSDIFLMPSRYEPCGLNQIYSLRYGTPPVVRATGGLDDTIEEDTGFKFQEYTGGALLGAINQALQAFVDKPSWRHRMRRGMLKDFSWNASASEYSALYGRLLKG